MEGVMKKINLDTIKQRLSERYPDQIFDFSNYVNTIVPIKAIDPEYGEWFPTVKNLLSKQRQHTLRRRNTPRNTISAQEVSDRVLSIHGHTILLDSSTFTNTCTKCRFIDKDYGEFWATPAHVCVSRSGHPLRGIDKNAKNRMLPIKEVVGRIKKIHGNTVVMKESSYVGIYHNATFIHKEYGEWEAAPSNVMKGSSHPDGWLCKSKTTCMEKYGVDSPMKDIKIFKQATKARWNTVLIHHWKTGEVLKCTASYEYAIVKTLNEKKIEFDWQIKYTFENGSVYFVDLYLLQSNTFVEIKGYFFLEKSSKKWEKFHKLVPNSEIWYAPKVMEFSGKTKRELGDNFKAALLKKNTKSKDRLP